MLTLKLNDSNCVTLKTGILPTRVDVNGVSTKALKIEIDGSDMDVAKIKEMFGTELATSEMTLETETGVASTHTGYTNLRSIKYDVDTDVYTIVLAKETDIPTMVANLEETVSKLMSEIASANDAVKAQYANAVKTTTESIDALQKNIQSVDRKLDNYINATSESNGEDTATKDTTDNTSETASEPDENPA